MFNNKRASKNSKKNKGSGTRSSRVLSALLVTVMAVTLLSGIPTGNMESVQAATTLKNPRKDSNGVVTWDCIYFGSYPQSDATGKTKEPIKWRVLSVDGNDAFLVADTNLDAQRYNDTNVDVTWETCTMRSWLNGYGSDSNVCEKDYSTGSFIDRAFTTSEQKAVKATDVVNADNPEYGTAGGNSTQDKIFLLSCDEVTNPDYGFSSNYRTSDNARKRINTAYVAKGGTIGSGSMYSEGSTDMWWLRSPGYYSSSATDVYSDGAVDQDGRDVYSYSRAVCPALHLNLSSSNLWSYAGTVSSDVGSTEGDNPPSGGEEPTTEDTKAEIGSEQKNTSIAVKNIKLTGISKKIAAGRKIALIPVFTPSNCSNKALKWKSSNSKYATVSGKGIVSTKKKGEGKNVTITAMAQDGSNVKAEYKIKLVKDAVKSVKLTSKSKSVKAGSKLSVKAIVKTTGKTANKTLLWTSSNKSYATVTKKGVVNTKKAGKGKMVKITAKATDGPGKKATIKIKIQ